MKNALLAAASVLFAIACVEVFLRIEDHSHNNIIVSDMELAGHRYRFLEDKQSFDAVENSVVIIGDSFTAGVACGNAGNYPGILRRVFREHLTGLNTINLGVGGTEVFSYLQRMEDFLESFSRPAAFVVTLYLNDVEFEPELCPYRPRLRQSPSFNQEELASLDRYCDRVGQRRKSDGYSPIRAAHRRLIGTLHSYRLARDATVNVALAMGIDIGWGKTSYQKKWSDVSGLEFKMILFALGEMKKLADRFDTPLIVVFYPDVGFLSRESHYYEMYGTASAVIAEKLGLPAYSGYEAFLNNENADESMVWSLTDKHPNCEAHRIFAGWAFDKLRQNHVGTNSPLEQGVPPFSANTPNCGTGEHGRKQPDTPGHLRPSHQPEGIAGETTR